MNFDATQTANCASSLVDPTSLQLPVNDSTDASAIFRFQFDSASIYFLSSMTLNVTMSGTFGAGGDVTETYRVVVSKNPNAITVPLTFGPLAPNLIPEPAHFFGTAAYHTVSTLTIIEYGALSFLIDLALITEVMTFNARVPQGSDPLSAPTITPWNRNLIFWVCPQDGLANVFNGLSTTATLTVSGTIAYPNRFTGLQGPWEAMSRVDECPVCGLRSPRETWGYSGWHKRMVGIECVDPADPYDTPLVIETEDPLGGGEDS